MATIAPPLTTASLHRAQPRQVLYPHAQWYFLAAMVTTWLGFSRSYFAVVRTEPLLHHIHGMLMGGWIAILAVQPILYQRGRIRLHRTLGRWAVYLWVPAMVVVGFFMDRRMLRTHNAPPKVIDQLAFLDLTSLILFPLLIALAIYYGRNLQLHARYIVCTVLLLMPPALGRLLGVVPALHGFQTKVNAGCALVDIALLILILDDLRRGKIRVPYPFMFVTFTAMTIASNYARNWAWWQACAKWMAGA